MNEKRRRDYTNGKIRNICANEKSENDRKYGCNEKARRIEDVNK